MLFLIIWLIGGIINISLALSSGNKFNSKNKNFKVDNLERYKQVLLAIASSLICLTFSWIITYTVLEFFLESHGMDIKSK